MRVLLLVAMAVGLAGMVERGPTPLPPPILLPASLSGVSIPADRGVTRGPADSFEFHLSTSPWPVEDWWTVRAIALCESSLDPTAVGSAGEVGLLQIHPTNRPLVGDGDLSDPSLNLQAGFEVYEEQGWAAWACYQ